MSDFIQENKLLIGVSALCLVVGATQIPAMQAHQTRNAAIAQSQADKLQQSDLIAAEQAASEGQIGIANERYDTGCELVATLSRADVAATIQEGRPIVGGAYAAKFDPKRPNPEFYLGRDVTVCDGYGTTAKTKFDPKLGYAVAANIAVTNDRARMAKAIASRPGMQRPNLLK
jgi:hypothetical protein